MKPARITPCLWFDFDAEQAVAYYLSVFPSGRVLRTSYYDEAMPEHAGQVLLIEFELEGQPLQALNGGPHFRFTEALSLSVACDDQAEVDRLWLRLTEDGGAESQCGWVKDKYGLSWQIVPVRMIELLNHADRAGARPAMQAMMGMRKIEIAAVQRAFDGH